MAQIFNPSIFSVVDTDGSVGIGWKLYFYQTGTSTLQNTYPTEADAVALTNANANPVLSLADGRFPAIWFASGNQYKVILKDENDVTLETTDPAMQADAIGNLISTASNKGAGMVGFSHSATYAASTVGKALQSAVCVDDHPYSAVGDGVTDDTAAVQAAFATGKTVVFTGSKSYRVVDTIDFAADGQQALLNGTTIYAVGNFNLFSIAGGLRGCGIHQGTLDGTGHTGGYMISLSDANRTFISDLTVHDPYNFLYGEKFNLLALNNVWVNNVTGDYGIHLYGENALRSDVGVFANVTISSHTTPKVAIGMLVDGLVHTINIQTMKLLNMNVGLQYKNTSGGTAPMFLFADNLEIEFSEEDGIDLQVGEHFYFLNLYSVSSTNASGVKVGAAVPSGRISITNGDIVDNALYGVDNPSTRVQVSGLSMYDNLSGDFSGEAYVHAPIHQVDDDFYLRVLGSNPIINFAPTDYFEYDRATNRLFLRVGGNDRFAVNSTGVEVYVNSAMKTIEVGAADSGGAGYRMLRVTN